MKKSLLSLIIAVFMAASPALAQVPNVDDLVQLRVIPGWRLANGNHVVGMEFTLAKGWKTYWRNPGDAGIPPEFNLSRSNNFRSFVTHWPVPGVYRDYGVLTIGYKDRVILPLEITPRRVGADISLRGTVNLGVCAEVCIPVDMNFTVKLVATDTTPDREIAAQLANQPKTISNLKCEIKPTKIGIILKTSLKHVGLGADEVFVVEVPGADLWVAETTSRRQGGTLHGETKIVNVAGNGVSFARNTVRATLLANGRAVQALGCAQG